MIDAATLQCCWPIWTFNFIENNYVSLLLSRSTDHTKNIQEYKLEKIESADFDSLMWKLDGVSVHPPTKALLECLAAHHVAWTLIDYNGAAGVLYADSYLLGSADGILYRSATPMGRDLNVVNAWRFISLTQYFLIYSTRYAVAKNIYSSIAAIL